jgi:hypothetical protein
MFSLFHPNSTQLIRFSIPFFFCFLVGQCQGYAVQDTVEVMPLNRRTAQFMLFGMGERRKLLYVPGGCLYDAVTLERIRAWKPRAESLDASEYRVTIVTDEDCQVRILEDEEAVWIEEDGDRAPLT